MWLVLSLIASFSALMPAFLSLTPPKKPPCRKYTIREEGLWRAQFTYFLFLSFSLSHPKHIREISLDKSYAVLYLVGMGSDKLYAAPGYITRFSTTFLGYTQFSKCLPCIPLPAQGGPTKMQNPPIDFLLVCSGMSLREFELNRLNQAANLRKHIRAIEDDLRQAEAEALFARWLIEHRDELFSAGRAQALQEVFEFMLPARPCLSADMAAGGPAAAAPRRIEGERRVKEICA